jgi:hypothetical protein
VKYVSIKFFTKKFPTAHGALCWKFVFGGLQHKSAVKAQVDIAFRAALVASSDWMTACVAGT